MKSLYRKGFTLIEVLVVISIVGILSTIIYASFGDARNDARNKAIQAELKNVQLALELYKAQNGRYPEANTLCHTVHAFPLPGYIEADSNACGANLLVPDLVPDFISELPSVSDSGNTNCNISYKTDGGGTWYNLTAENCAAGVTLTTGVQSGDEFARCLLSCGISCDPLDPDFYESYAIYSLGGECL
jgi:prepilin-type N-terminal cleavage/methylation domain-containing protein